MNYCTHTHTHTHTQTCIYIYIYIYMFECLQEVSRLFWYMHLKLSKTLEHSVCYCYTSIEMSDQLCMIPGSNEQLQQQLKYTLLKPDCHGCGISKLQSGREDALEERYAIKFCFKLGKNYPETYGMLQTAFGASCMNQESVFVCHKWFKEGRESVMDD